MGARYFIIAVIFILGFALGLLISQQHGKEINDLSIIVPDNSQVLKERINEMPSKISIEEAIPKKINSPQDRIKEKDIKIYNRRIMINVNNAVIARFTDTKSMEPVLNKDTNAIEIVPKDINEIHVGDIISYESAFSDGIIIHRVIEKSIDEKGIYFRAKGDNLNYIDPEKIRFDMIKRVVVGILY